MESIEAKKLKNAITCFSNPNPVGCGTIKIWLDRNLPENISSNRNFAKENILKTIALLEKHKTSLAKCTSDLDQIMKNLCFLKPNLDYLEIKKSRTRVTPDGLFNDYDRETDWLVLKKDENKDYVLGTPVSQLSKGLKNMYIVGTTTTVVGGGAYPSGGMGGMYQAPTKVVKSTQFDKKLGSLNMVSGEIRLENALLTTETVDYKGHDLTQTNFSYGKDHVVNASQLQSDTSACGISGNAGDLIIKAQEALSWDAKAGKKYGDYATNMGAFEGLQVGVYNFKDAGKSFVEGITGLWKIIRNEETPDPEGKNQCEQDENKVAAAEFGNKCSGMATLLKRVLGGEADKILGTCYRQHCPNGAKDAMGTAQCMVMQQMNPIFQANMVGCVAFMLNQSYGPAVVDLIKKCTLQSGGDEFSRCMANISVNAFAALVTVGTSQGITIAAKSAQVAIQGLVQAGKITAQSATWLINATKALSVAGLFTVDMLLNPLPNDPQSLLKVRKGLFALRNVPNIDPDVAKLLTARVEEINKLVGPETPEVAPKLDAAPTRTMADSKLDGPNPAPEVPKQSPVPARTTTDSPKTSVPKNEFIAADYAKLGEPEVGISGSGSANALKEARESALKNKLDPSNASTEKYIVDYQISKNDPSIPAPKVPEQIPAPVRSTTDAPKAVVKKSDFKAADYNKINPEVSLSGSSELTKAWQNARRAAMRKGLDPSLPETRNFIENFYEINAANILRNGDPDVSVAFREGEIRKELNALASPKDKIDLTPEEYEAMMKAKVKAVMEAHQKPGAIGELSPAELKAKVEAMKAAKMSSIEIRTVIEKGLAGNSVTKTIDDLNPVPEVPIQKANVDNKGLALGNAKSKEIKKPITNSATKKSSKLASRENFDRDPKGFIESLNQFKTIDGNKNPFSKSEYDKFTEALDRDMADAVKRGDPIAGGSVAHMDEHDLLATKFAKELEKMGIDPQYYQLLAKAHDMGKFIPDEEVLSLAKKWANDKIPDILRADIVNGVKGSEQAKNLIAKYGNLEEALKKATPGSAELEYLTALAKKKGGNEFLLGRISWHDQSTIAYLIKKGDELNIPKEKIDHLISDIIGHNDGSAGDVTGIFWKSVGWPEESMGAYPTPKRLEADVLAFNDRYGQGNQTGAQKIFKTVNAGQNLSKDAVQEAFLNNPKNTIRQLESIGDRITETRGVSNFKESSLYSEAINAQQDTIKAFKKIEWKDGAATVVKNDGTSITVKTKDEFLSDDFQKALYEKPIDNQAKTKAKGAQSTKNDKNKKNTEKDLAGNSSSKPSQKKPDSIGFEPDPKVRLFEGVTDDLQKSFGDQNISKSLDDFLKSASDAEKAGLKESLGKIDLLKKISPDEANKWTNKIKRMLTACE